MSQALQEEREHRELRRRCYTELQRDARQFCTALSRHLYVMRDRAVGEEDAQALMVAPDAVVDPARAVNGALSAVYGQVKRLEQGNPRPGETLRSAAEAQHAVWTLIAAAREAMRRDLGITTESGEPPPTPPTPTPSSTTSRTRAPYRCGPEPAVVVRLQC